MGFNDRAAFSGLFTTIGAEADSYKDGDYSGPEGLLHCGVCREAKERVFPLPDFMHQEMGTEMKRPCECRCQRERREMEERERIELEHMNAIKALRVACMPDSKLITCTFTVDDQKDVNVSKTCRLYAEKWTEMCARNTGVILWGEVGSGKTFYAACIANALIEKQIAAKIRNLPDLVARMSSDYGEGRAVVLDEVRRVPLLILDDLGFERTTPTGLENAFTIINTRYDSGKPMIVTTNLTPDEIKSPTNLAHRRSLDRIWEMCPIVLQVKCGRRNEIAKNKRLEALVVLYGGGNDGR